MRQRRRGKNATRQSGRQRDAALCSSRAHYNGQFPGHRALAVAGKRELLSPRLPRSFIMWPAARRPPQQGQGGHLAMSEFLFATGIEIEVGSVPPDRTQAQPFCGKLLLGGRRVALSWRIADADSCGIRTWRRWRCEAGCEDRQEVRTGGSRGRSRWSSWSYCRPRSSCGTTEDGLPIRLAFERPSSRQGNR